MTQFGFEFRTQDRSGKRVGLSPDETLPKLIEDSRSAFSKLGKSHRFEYFQVTDLGSLEGGEFDPVSLLSNFGDGHDAEVQRQTSMTHKSLYPALEKTSVPFGWQVGADQNSVGGNLDKPTIADSKTLDFLVGFNIRHGYSVPVYSSRGGRAVVNYFETNGDIADHYPGLMFNTTQLFERHFSPVDTDLEQSTSQLSELQKQCLIKLAEGMSPNDVGSCIGLSEHAFNAIVRIAAKKLGARSTMHAIALIVSDPHIKI